MEVNTGPPEEPYRITLTIEQYLERLIDIVPVACVRCTGEVLLHPPEDDLCLRWLCGTCAGGPFPVSVEGDSAF